MTRTINKFYDSIHFFYNGFHNPQDGHSRLGRFFMHEDGQSAAFLESAPRLHKSRNQRIFRDDRTLLMRTPDGRFRLYCTFRWQGNKTWKALIHMLKEVYAALKSTVHGLQSTAQDVIHRQLFSR